MSSPQFKGAAELDAAPQSGRHSVPIDPLASDRGQSTDRQLVDRRSSIKSFQTASSRSSVLKASVLSSNSARGLTGANKIQKGAQQQKAPSKLHKFLQYIDIYPFPIQVHVENKFHQPTFCGGILSMITYIVLGALIVIKGYSIIDEYGNEKVNTPPVRRLHSLDSAIAMNQLGRFLQEAPADPTAEAAADGIDAAADAANATLDNETEPVLAQEEGESEGGGDCENCTKNFKFWTYSDEDFNATNYGGEALPIKDYGIGRVHVTMNLQSFFEQYDQDMLMALETLSKITQEDIDNGDMAKHFLGNTKMDQNLLEEAQNFLEKKPFKDVTRFFSVKWNQTKADERMGAFASIDDDDPGPLANIIFQVEIKTMAGKNEKSKVKKVYFSAEDFDWSVPYQPTLDITDHIKVMGDFYSDSEDDVRTVTTFRMIADYETLVQKVYDDTVGYFEAFMNSPREWQVDVEQCGDLVEYANDPNYYSDAQRAQMAADWDEEKADLIKDFSSNYEVFDEVYQKEVAEYEAQLDADKHQEWQDEINDYIEDAEYTSKEYPSYPTSFLDQFEENAKNCYNVSKLKGCEYWAGPGDCPNQYEIPVYTKFIDVFNTNLAQAFNDLKSSFESQAIFDSLQLHVTPKSSNTPDLVIQDANYKKNFKCFNYAVQQAEDTYNKWCTKYEEIVYFKLTDYTSQKVEVDARRGLDIKEVDYSATKSKMKVARKMSTVRKQMVGREDIYEYPAVDYETLWQVSFALENKVTHARQIKFIQDEDEEGESKRLLAESGEETDQEEIMQATQRKSKGLKVYLVAMLDMCAFIGGAWFILTRVVFGPMSQMFEKNLYVADVDQKVILKEFTGELAPGQKQAQANDGAALS